MATTTIPFQPQANVSWYTEVTLDGGSYLLVALWLNGRWFLNCQDASGNRIFTFPLIGSPDPISVASATYDYYRSKVILTTTNPHNYVVGSMINATVAGFTPSGYNGTYLCEVNSPTTLSYSLASSPGLATSYGTVSTPVNILYGFFSTSTLVFLDSSQTFVLNS